jgi:hypothetical protein
VALVDLDHQPATARLYNGRLPNLRSLPAVPNVPNDRCRHKRAAASQSGSEKLLPREIYGYDSRVHGARDDGDDERHDDEEQGKASGEVSKSKLDKSLPPALRPGGKVEKVLKRSRKIYTDEIYQRMLAACLSILTSLQQKLRSLPANSDKQTRKTVVLESLNTIDYGTSVDNGEPVRFREVFRYFLALDLGLKQDEHVVMKARDEFRTHLHVYSGLFAELVPDQLRSEFEFAAYSCCTNSSALEDWSVFKRLTADEANDGPGLLTDSKRSMNDLAAYQESPHWPDHPESANPRGQSIVWLDNWSDRTTFACSFFRWKCRSRMFF